MLDIYGLSHDDQARLTQARYERLAASPGTALTLAKALCDFDVRDDLAAITAPTLVRVHPNPVLDLQHGRDVAARIPGARVEEAADEWRWMTETDLEATSFASLTEFLGLRYDPHPQRVLATVLFTDIVGSTETAAAMGDQRWHLLLSAHNRAVDRQVSAAGGQIAHSTGDGVLAVFSTPTMALRAAVAIRDELRDCQCGSEQDCTPVRSSRPAPTCKDSTFISAHASRPSRPQTKYSSRAPSAKP